MKVSVITVCFNCVDTIEDTIKSVLSQDYDNIEYIIVDGNSTDGTMNVIEKYSDRIDICISEPDDGVYFAMNKGIEVSTGDIIGFLNAGDFFAENNSISCIASVFSNRSCQCVYSDLEYVAPDDTAKTVRKWKSSPYHDGMFKRGWHPPHPTFYALKKVFMDYGLFDTNYSIGADYDLMLRFIHKYKNIPEYIPQVLVKMRIGGISNKDIFHIIKANIECYKAWGKNGLNVSPLIMLRKPCSKLMQYFKRKF